MVRSVLAGEKKCDSRKPGEIAAQLPAAPPESGEAMEAILRDFDAMDAAYREFFPDGAYPARTTTESPHLFGGSKVEITCQVLR